MSVGDNIVSALVDGELTPADAARLEADPALAARIAAARALRQAVAGAYADTAAEAPPERLLAAIRGPAPGEVIDLALPRSVRRRRPSIWAAAPLWGGLAASLALAFALGRMMAPTPGPITAAPGGGLVANGVLAGSLQRQLVSSQAPDAPVTIGVSFLSSDGRYCRTFTLRQAAPVAGLACRDPAGWSVRLAVAAAPSAPGTTYRTAAAETPQPVLDAVDRTIRGEPLDAAGEAKARAAGWRAAP